MCDYCEGRKNFMPKYSGEGIHTAKMNLGLIFGFNKDDYIAHIENGILYVDNSSGEYAQLGFKINYCPNCGAKIPQSEVEDGNE